MSSGDEDDDDLPAWITNHQSPLKHKTRRCVISISDSDSDVGAPPAKAVASGQISTPSCNHGHGSDANRDVKAASEDQSRSTINTNNPVTLEAQASVEKEVQTSQRLEQSRDAKHTANSQSIAGLPDRSPHVGADPTPRSHPGGSSHLTKLPLDSIAPKIASRAVVASVAGEVPVMLADKLSTYKILAELESLDGGHTDLAGDSGAVGRILVEKDEEGEHHMQFDLKGLMYDAKHAPLAGTLMVVNIGQEEARVQSVFDTFLQLNRTSAFADQEGDQKLFMDDDEDSGHDTVYAGKAAGDGKKATGQKKNRDSKSRAKSGVAGGVRKTTSKRKPAARKK